MSTENRWVKEARERGHRAYRHGIPYDHCPYLTMPGCPEGAAWQNAWLAERESERKREKHVDAPAARN